MWGQPPSAVRQAQPGSVLIPIQFAHITPL